MSPQEKAFQAALRERLATRAQLLLATDREVLALLQAARGAIMEQLATLPSDFNQWRLPQLLAQLQAVLDGATGSAAGRTRKAQ